MLLLALKNRYRLSAMNQLLYQKHKKFAVFYGIKEAYSRLGCLLTMRLFKHLLLINYSFLCHKRSIYRENYKFKQINIKKRSYLN